MAQIDHDYEIDKMVAKLSLAVDFSESKTIKMANIFTFPPEINDIRKPALIIKAKLYGFDATISGFSGERELLASLIKIVDEIITRHDEYIIMMKFDGDININEVFDVPRDEFRKYTDYIKEHNEVQLEINNGVKSDLEKLNELEQEIIRIEEMRKVETARQVNKLVSRKK